MKRKTLIYAMVLVVLISACGTAATTPASSNESAQSTVPPTAAPQETQTTIPTVTSPPPTNTPVDTPTLTFTPFPSPTATPLDTATATARVCNQPLTSWKVPTTKFSIVNETKPKGTITLSLSVLTAMGECGYLVITGDSFNGPVGGYSAFAYVNGDKNFTVSGSFIIKNVPYKILVRNDRIIEAYACYPHC